MHLRERIGRRFPRAFLGLAILWLSSPVGAQPVIEHDGLDCLARGRFTRLVARIAPPDSVRAAKVYFRSTLYSDFYFVEMTEAAGGGFEAILPSPVEETSRIIYYIEAVDITFQTARSEELLVAVSGDASCEPGPGGALFPGGDPGIVVGSTRAGAAALPPGFQASGITGLITAAGVIASTGGGGIGVGVAVGAAAGAAGGVAVLVSSGESSNGTSTTSTEPVSGGSTSSSPTTTTTASSSSPSTSTPSTTTTIGGGSTTTIVGTPTTSSTTTTSPSTTTSSVPGTSTTSSISGTTTTSSPAGLTACFRWEAVGSCRVFFESCSTPQVDIVRYDWRMLGPPVPEPPSSASFTFSFDADPRCRVSSEFNHPVRLTVFDQQGRSASEQQNVTVRSGAAYRAHETEMARLSFTSRVLASSPDARGRVQLVVNGRPLAPMDAASPARFQIAVPEGLVRMEATFTPPLPPSSLLELGFASGAVVPGSLEVETGMASASDGERVVFRLSGDAGEVIRFRFRIR